jgi:hypothetical protein
MKKEYQVSLLLMNLTLCPVHISWKMTPFIAAHFTFNKDIHLTGMSRFARLLENCLYKHAIHASALQDRAVVIAANEQAFVAITC